MSSENPNYSRIAEQAAADLNTYQSKTGNARPQSLDEAGVNSYAEKKFDGAEVTYGKDLTKPYGVGKGLDPVEGNNAGNTTNVDEALGRTDEKGETAFRGHQTGPGGHGDAMSQGKEASVANVGRDPPGVGGGKFKGDDYYVPESVPDSISAEGYVAPESVTEASKETEGYGR